MGVLDITHCTVPVRRTGNCVNSTFHIGSGLFLTSSLRGCVVSEGITLLDLLTSYRRSRGCSY
jgi:hypothetical protein